MPLVHADEREQAAHGQAHEEARKIHPRMARGALRRVTVAGNLAEAELIKGVLLEQGIPSLIRRTAGFDVPDFLAAGPRDILVPEAAFTEASGLLAEIDADHAEAQSGSAGSAQAPEPRSRSSRPVELRLAAGILAALLAFGALASLLFALLR